MGKILTGGVWTPVEKRDVVASIIANGIDILFLKFIFQLHPPITK